LSTLRPACVVVAAVCLTSAAGAVRAGEKLDKAAERWLKEVGLLILPDEETTYRGLKDGSDRKEFETLFWARRDPDPSTPANELQDAVTKARTRADQLFGVPGRKGSETGCGQLLALLGEPTEVEGREISEQFSSLQAMREGARRPEVWIYRTRPGDRLQLTGGELRVPLDEECRFSEGGKVQEDLRRAAEARVTRPEIDYRRKPDGHLVPLAELGQTASPARALLETPRADFPLALEPKLLLRTQGGDAYAAGLVRAEVAGAANASGADPVSATVVAQAADADGKPSPAVERSFKTTAGPDGLVASYGLTLKPGRYTLKVGLMAGVKGAVATAPLEVPDFQAPGLKLGSLLVYPETKDAAGLDPQGAYGAFAVGALRLQPRFGNVFAKDEALQAVCVLSGGQADPGTGKPSVRARYSFLKDGKPVAKGQDETYDTPMAAAALGPVPLSSFGPGRYVVRLEVTDVVAQKTETRDTAFEIHE
jgi:GWxTD domain-containing protein